MSRQFQVIGIVALSCAVIAFAWGMYQANCCGRPTTYGEWQLVENKRLDSATVSELVAEYKQPTLNPYDPTAAEFGELVKRRHVVVILADRIKNHQLRTDEFDDARSVLLHAAGKNSDSRLRASATLHMPDILRESMEGGFGAE